MRTKEPWQEVRCDYTNSGICAAKIAAACICQTKAYRLNKALEERDALTAARGEQG